MLSKEVTGYKSKVRLDEGIERTYSWYKEHVFEKAGDTPSRSK